MRCKHCGQVMAAKGSPAVQTARRTPPPASRPTAPAVPVAQPAYPVAAPVALPAAAAHGSPFDAFDPTNDEARPSARRRRKSGGGWKGPVVALLVLVVAGGVTALTWPRISPILFPTEDEKVAANTGDSGATSNSGGVKDNAGEEPRKAPVPPASARRPGPRPSTQPKRPGDPTKEPVNPTRPGPTKEGNTFPRRALVISVHDYLYANPVSYGMPGSGSHSIAKFCAMLGQENGFKIPLTQVAHLSDVAEKGEARPPMRSVIEGTLKDFLDGSRAQDRIMVFFIGHALVSGDDAYLVPIEGELDNAATLIPLKWVYEQLAACKARQKVLVLDVNRFSPTRGLERPDAGPMDPKFEKALKSPPAGVQVWSACSAGQHSYETDDAPQGAFLEALYAASQRGTQNMIQRHGDPLPLDFFKTKVDELMAADLKRRKQEQVSFLGGKMAEEGAPYDKNEPLAKRPTLAPMPDTRGNEKLVKAVLDQIGTPGVKPSQNSEELKYDALPPFDPKVLKKYEDDSGTDDSPLRKAVRQARALLWAVSSGSEPSNLRAEVQSARTKLKGTLLTILQDGFRAPASTPAGEKNFKDGVQDNQRDVARIMGRLTEVLEELEAAGETRDAEPKRWQANYDFMKARLQAEIAFLYEYESMLGQMRKEFPPRDPALHNGWRLAAKTDLQGDSKGKKLAKESRKTLDKLAKDHAGTPWEVLAKREKLTALGLEWQPTK
jgi:hypothetical protein